MTAIALTIAGSDSSGGAGIQADLKTFSALGVYGASAITAITAQNTLGVSGIHDVPADFVAQQIHAVLSDLAVNAIKIGMLSVPQTIEAVADALAQYPDLPLILDPVMVATSGDSLLTDAAVETLIARLLPMAFVITPNLHEAAKLLRSKVAQNEDEMLDQAHALLALGPEAVLIKGGHGSGAESIDLLVSEDSVLRLTAPRLETKNTHGTGCTLSSALAAGIAKGYPLETAAHAAKAYVTGAIHNAEQISIGKGHGPTHHFFAWWA